MDEDARQEDWQTYVANVGGQLVKLWSKGSKLPLYSDLFKDERKKADSRSGQEIVDDLVSRRRRRRRMEVKNSETV